MPEPSKLPMSPSAPEHTTVAPTPILPPAGIPTPALPTAPLPPPTAAPGGPIGPGLVTHFKCKECGGLLDSEFAMGSTLFLRCLFRNTISILITRSPNNNSSNLRTTPRYSITININIILITLTSLLNSSTMAATLSITHNRH
ncbi:hypothetical protein BGZ96_002484 [Linnemannia gamsii]|uniref:LITAF domain-containing protein n=1 Tax=Linnemannia gamsii TaxID=64522 RepID=A0ABQ7JKS6_9FUNG|nr:hypothetical protein BGZ96_002484 [Linnemannia gamsii]